MPQFGSPNDYRADLRVIANRLLSANLRPKAGDADLVQDTWLAAWTCRAQAPHPPDAFRAWLRGILRKRFLRLHRRYITTAKRSVLVERPLDAAEPATVPDPNGGLGGNMARNEVIAALQCAVARLGTRERTVVTLRLEHELAWHDIAIQLGSTEEAVRKVFSRALVRLRARLAPHLDGLDAE
jgi:RNA polymerase sigma factor (sigma-70 family)